MAEQQSLLRWGIENSAPGELLKVGNEIKAGTARTDLTSAMLKHIMGKSNADRMVECMQVIQGHWVDDLTKADQSHQVTFDDRIRAWDDLEMLIEDLDNANDLKFLNLWKPIIAALSDENDDIRMRACWVCGTAVQNNPKAQEAFLELDPLPVIHSLIISSVSSAATRSKAMYCLSATLKHSPLALRRFDELEGWKVLNSSLRDSSITLRTKSAFLLSSMILQSTSSQAPASTEVTTFPSNWSTTQYVAAFRAASILSTLIISLSPSEALPTGPDGDIETIDSDYKEKALRVLVNIVSLSSGEHGLSDSERRSTRDVAEAMEKEGVDLDELGLAKAEWEEFRLGLE